MAKIYGTPIMAGGAGGANKDLPPLLDNFRAKAKGNISKKGHGEAVNIIDSIESELNGLKLYGKSTQDGTPTPEAPVPIVSTGDNGAVEITISGENIFDPEKLSFSNVEKQEDDFFFKGLDRDSLISLPVNNISTNDKLSLTYTAWTSDGGKARLWTDFYPDIYGGDVGNTIVSEKTTKSYSFSPKIDIDSCNIRMYIPYRTLPDQSPIYLSQKIMLVRGSQPKPYSPFVSKKLNVNLINNLFGIPVDSGGNYTDADGQQWICDEIDFVQKKYVQRFKMLEFDGTEDWSRSPANATEIYRMRLSLDNVKAPSSNNITAATRSTHYPAMSASATWLREQGVSVDTSANLIVYDDNHNTTIEDWKSYLAAQKAAGTPVKVVYELETPVETDIPEETIEAYKSLTTYAPVTNIMTDSTPAAGIEIEYASTTMNVELSANKMEASRANELAGAVWVYGDHEPESVNDGTKIQLSREEIVDSGSAETGNQTVSKTIQWNAESDFFARQFTYNSKKQYQTMLEGAIATLVLTGVPDPVTELAETHSSSSITLTWKNPTSDELYNHTVVVYKTDTFPTSIDDGTQGYTGTDETATLSDLERGTTYYIAVFTVSYIGVYGQPETVQVEIPAGQLLSSLASGTKVKLGKWNNTDLQWKIARDTSDQSIRLVLEPTSVSLLGNKQYDAPEPRNSNSDRRTYGNNRYIYSNIHQWLNATKASGWYTAQHSADAAPDYSSQAGFLSGWSENHIAALDGATLTVSRTNIDGGGTETFVARVALLSTTELGLESGTGGGRFDIFNSDGDRSIGSLYWTRTPNRSDPVGAGDVAATGFLYDNTSVRSVDRVRPLCIPVSTALVSLEMDDDNCYVVQ